MVDQVYDEEAAAAMQLKKGTVCVMIHTGSRGLGHQVQCLVPLAAVTYADTSQQGQVVGNSTALHYVVVRLMCCASAATDACN